MKIKVKAATLNSLTSMEAFNLDQLKRISDTCTGVPVTIEFDSKNIIGKITASEIIQKELFVEAEINKEDFELVKDQYLVPGFELPEYKSREFGVTSKPQDLSLDIIQ